MRRRRVSSAPPSALCVRACLLATLCHAVRGGLSAEEDLRRLWESTSLHAAEQGPPGLDALDAAAQSAEWTLSPTSGHFRPGTYREGASLSGVLREEDFRSSRRPESVRFSPPEHSPLDLREGVYDVSDWRIAAAASTFRPARQKQAGIRGGGRQRRPSSAAGVDPALDFALSAEEEWRGLSAAGHQQQRSSRPPPIVGRKTLLLGVLASTVPLSRLFRDTLVGRVVNAYTRMATLLVNKVAPVEIAASTFAVGVGLALLASGAFDMAKSLVARREYRGRRLPHSRPSAAAKTAAAPPPVFRQYPVRGEVLVVIGLLSLLLATHNGGTRRRAPNERLDLLVGLMFPSLFAGLALLLGSFVRRMLQSRTPEAALVLGLTNEKHFSSSSRPSQPRDKVLDAFGVPDRRGRRP